MKVLIVDDSGVMRKVLKRELIKLGIQESDMVEAEDGLEGVKHATSQSFGLILMDWNMPNLLGIDAVQAIRKAGVTTPILMVTTEGEKTNVIKAIQAGANNYLVKPFEGNDLQDRIKQLVGDKLLQAESQAVTATTVNLNTGQVLAE